MVRAVTVDYEAAGRRGQCPQCGTYPEGTFNVECAPIDRLTRAIDWGLLVVCIAVVAMCVVAMGTLLGWI